MSYNIDHNEIISRSDSFGITRKNLTKLRRWADQNEDKLPEGCLDGQCWYNDDSTDQFIPIHDIWFYGEGSGWALEVGAFNKLCSYFSGTADVVFYWEGGNSVSGYRITDGKVTEHHVIVSLGDPV